MATSLLYAAMGTGFTFLMTVTGAAMVLFIKEEVHPAFEQIFFGFAAGVMIAASVWSLIIPAIERAEENGQTAWLVTTVGILLGVIFLIVFDRFFDKIFLTEIGQRIRTRKGNMLMVLAVTLHNIPEGMAVGLSFALAVLGDTPMLFASAVSLALGIGIQNIPEGAAISLPIKNEGVKKGTAFLIGSLSGIVEPIFGVLVVLIVSFAKSIMPVLLSFAAGAMLYVVADELIPKAKGNGSNKFGTIGVIMGFLIMMILDITL